MKELNKLYHTRIDGDNIKKIIERLVNYGNDFEEEIKSGNREEVIKKLVGCVEGSNNFSFATKYCNESVLKWYILELGIVKLVTECICHRCQAHLD